jgi:hypothetical protein
VNVSAVVVLFSDYPLGKLSLLVVFLNNGPLHVTPNSQPADGWPTRQVRLANSPCATLDTVL